MSDAPGRIRAVAIISIIMGALLVVAGAALLILALPLLDFTGRLRIVTALLFVDLALAGVAGVANGVLLLRDGRQNGAVRLFTFATAALFLILCLVFNSAYQATR